MRRLFILFACLIGTIAFAQESDEGGAEEGAAPKPPTLAAPYDDQLLRLSEVLGSIHHLRNLCGTSEETQWRNHMESLIVSEKPEPERRARLIARFNRGYRSFAELHIRCTPAARLALERYMREGIRLSSQIVGRYGR